jgi:hypothetical protein
MKLRTPISAWRTTFFATLGLTPLVACSSSDHAGIADAGSTGGVTTTGGTTSTGGNSSGGSAGGGGMQTTGGAAGKGGGGTTSTGGVAGASSGGSAGSGGNAGSGGSSGSAGSGAGTAGTDGGDGTDAGRLACRNPMPRLGPDGMPTGFVDCENGFTHRPEKRTCGSSIPRSVQCTNPDGRSGTCTQDSDCTAQPLGYCELSNGPAGSSCNCHYGCTTDAECGTGEICGCSDPVGACVPTHNCTSDADCGPGLLCITSSDGGCGYTFACQTPKDTCATSADCDVSSMCAFVVDHHECAPHRPCSTGRPFLVGGSARVAPVVNDRAWKSSLAPCMDELDPAARAVLVAHWTQIALMEHASIAAFARFALELLSLGAPPELLSQTHRALADETTHARDAFALASAYAGEAIGPGPLSMQGAMDSRSFDEIVETAVLEGCIGETVAALEASEALAFATDESVRAALSRVVEDEARHAELAYRFVRWALEVSPKAKRAALRGRILGLLDAGLNDARDGVTRDTDAPLLARHGLLPSHTRTLIRARALSEVVAPCLVALLVGDETAAAQAAKANDRQPAASRIDA